MTDPADHQDSAFKSNDIVNLDNHDNSASFKQVSAGSNFIPFRGLSEHYPKINAFSNSVGWTIILVVMLVIDLVVDEISLHFLVVPGLLILSLLSGVIGYFSAKVCGYYQDEFDIYFKQGLWWKKQTALNYSRIQHIDISHGPLERRYKMATIKFFTAGGAASDLRIAGLPNEQAEQLRSDILQYAKENALTDELPSIMQDASVLSKQAQHPLPTSAKATGSENNNSTADGNNE